MLQPLPSPQPLRPEAYFYDPFHRTLYYLQAGLLRAHLQAQNKQQPISIQPSTPSPRALSLPSLIAVSGEVVSNAFGNIVAASSEEAKVRSTVEVGESSHWQWHVPLALSNVALGICIMKEDEIESEELVEFNSSTARTVSFCLKHKELNVWVNGTRPAKKSARTLQFDPTRQKIFPLAKIKERGTTVVFSPFLTTSISEVSSYNPFGALHLEEPKVQEQASVDIHQSVKIKKLVELSEDRMLLVWQNNQIQVVNRNQQSKQFNFPSVYVQKGTVYGLFSEDEYNTIRNWRGDKALFKWSHMLPLRQAFEWLRHLISELDNQKSQRKDLYRIFLTKLLLIRPQLESIGERIPNLSLHCKSDIANYSLALAYFQGYRNIKKSLLNLAQWTSETAIEGYIKCITSNYLLTSGQKQVIIYYIGKEIKEIFREQVTSFNLNKLNLVDSYDESDLRYIQKDGSYLYKILTASLNPKKKEDEKYSPSPNDVQQLVSMYKIEEKVAIAALQQTGNVEEALVWIFTKQGEIERQADILNQQGQQAECSFCLIQVKNKFTRLLLTVNKTLYVLGILPKQIHRLIERGQNEFIDLVSFKHENSIDEIDYERWYQGNTHPQLHLLDSVALSIKPELLARENQTIYYVFTSEETRQRQEVVLSTQHLFELKPSITLAATSTPLSQQFQTGELIRSIQGELISPEIEDHCYEDNTTVIINSRLYSNCTFSGSAAVRLLLKTNQDVLNQTSGRTHNIPMTIEHGPPGVNKNYTIASILGPNGSFLANYPQGLRLRHLHNLVMSVSSIKLRRCVHRKNINYIVEGVIYFRDIWGNASEAYPFKFGPEDEEVTVSFKEGQYWKQMFLQPKFTNLKKLPYEIGSFVAQGRCLPENVFLRQYKQNISVLLNSHSNSRLFIHSVTPLTNSLIQIDVTCQNLEQLEHFTIKADNLQVLSKNGVTLQIDNASHEFIESKKPAQVLKHMTKNYTKLYSFLKHLSRSPFFTLAPYEQQYVRQFVDLVLFSSEHIENQEYYRSIFEKIWQNNHGKEYLLNLSSSLCDSPPFPRQYLQLLIASLPQKDQLQSLKAALAAVNRLRSKQYRSLNSQLPYLYFQDEFYSDYYFNLVDPRTKTEQDPVFGQSVIKTDIAVFKSDYTRRIIVKLPAIYLITNFTLRTQRCDFSPKVHYTVYALTSHGKRSVGSGFILEHQWSQITQLPYKQDIQRANDSESDMLNVFGLEVAEINAQYIEVEIRFTETGIIGHESETSRIAQIDILPELYGYEVDTGSPLQSVEQMLGFNPEDMFFLSVSKLLKMPMKKFSISKGKNLQFLYYTPQKEDLGALKVLLQEKIQKRQLQAIVSIQRKIIANKSFSHKICLDYLYTLITATLTHLQKQNIQIDDDICELIFSTIVESAQGPIKILGFKAISHKIHLLIKSLQYIERELEGLGQISFSYQQLVDTADFSNPDLCKSLTRLILRGVPYEQKWAELLIRMSPRTEVHQDIIDYFITKEDWLNNQQILDYLSSLSDQIYVNSFLNSVSYFNLSKLVLSASAKPRLDMLLEAVVERASHQNPVDLDVISLIFQQEEVRWEQLETVISSCPQATDTVIHQFLQSDIPELLARQHSLLFHTAASPKYSEQFAVFLEKVYQKDKRIFTELILSLNESCETLHYDVLETIGKFISQLCYFGGVEGVRLVSEEALANLQAAVSMLKLVQKLPEGAELPNEDLFIDWYLSNNDYELTSVNPAHKSPAYHLMRHLVDEVLSLIKTSQPSKVLAKYMNALKGIKQSKRISLAKRHLLFNQLHHGASILLGHTLTPGSLASVFVSGQTPLLASVLNDLKASTLKKSPKSGKWLPSKQVDITENFQVKDIADVKDLQVGKSGSKSAAAKIPISQKKIKLTSQTDNFPTKINIGFCLNDNADNKNALLPSRVQVFGGNDKTILKIGDMTRLQDQFYLSYGVAVYALNLNAVQSGSVHSLRNLQFKLYDPLLCSASEVLEGGQRSKKGATYNISFISLHGYDSQPSEEPDYSLMYVTLLGFLGQKKYINDLREVIKAPQFDQKLQLIIQVLNDLLPNEEIEELLLGLNREGENILEFVLKSKGANPRLVNSLILGKLTKENINKLIEHTLTNISNEFVNIVVLSLRLASYAQPAKDTAQTIANFDNIKMLLDKYENARNETKILYQRLINSLLTVPSLYNYDISKVIGLIWVKPERHRFYPLLAAILPYYPSQLQNFSSKKLVLEVMDELERVLSENQNSNSVLTNPLSHLQLISTLSLNESCRQQLLERRAPIKVMQLIKSTQSILVKYGNETMKLLISFFQSTCIGTSCQDEFSEILIDVMTSLNDFNPAHHNYFIHSFFFPLINAFKGVPVVFVWKFNNQYLKQVTDVLHTRPIRSSSDVITFQQQCYSPISSIDKQSLSSNLIFVEKQTEKVCYQLNRRVLIDVAANKQRNYEFKEGKVVIQVSQNHNIALTPEKFKVFEENQWEKHLLTNSTLLSLNNPWVLNEKYHGVLPINDSTFQRFYFLPQEIEVAELLKQVNICGFKIHSLDLPQIKVRNYATGREISQNETLNTIIKEQKEPYLKIEIEAAQIFKNSTIQSLAKEEVAYDPFVPQETIFKAFELKKGLQKMITVLKGSVKNWTNAEQSNIWGQYLKELESYSCFPVFSSLYINKQSNVALLFDLLLSLPDKQDSKKWLQKEKESVKELYTIIKDVFTVKGEQAQIVREYALKSGFYSTMLQRLHMITKEPRRVRIAEDKVEEEEEVLPTIEKKPSEDDFKSRLQKRQGVGYGTDSSTNQKWDVTGQEEARKEKSQQILSLLTILEQFFDCENFNYPAELLNQTYESALLPIVQSSLRGGSLLEISKFAELFKGQLGFIQVLAKCPQLVAVLMPIPKFYEPKQPQSIYSLLKTLANTSKIFLACLTGSASEKTSEEIAKKIITTYQIVEEAISEYETTHYNEDDEERKIMELPLPKKYPLLMKDLRFDYIDMKDSSNKISKHHYASNYQPGHKPPVDKTIRLAQELADLSHALPIDHTNAIYVRCDKERVDFMQALIMGSNGTPYGHGAYLFDIYFEDNYPNGPPKVNLMTTGAGQIRFNPNLYACGKVCLSLLGTWRGNAMENWDAKVSTLLQVLVSIQSIIMSEDIYFNEPGFEHEAGTPEGEKKNEAYANIVRYGNVKFAMLENIKNPPKGFQSVIRRHFYLKKDEIMEECHRWLKLAEKREASYNGLVSDHNYNWCNNFKKSKTEYKAMLEKAVKELEDQLKKLPVPTHQDFKKQTSSPTKPKRKHTKALKEDNLEPVLEEIDVSYGATKEYQELDVNDERVKDRWSRYIGAMGVQAVTKQSKASIILLGLGAVGVETAKNIVLSGCKELAIWDDKPVQYSDLSGQFFLGETDIGNSRIDSSFYKLQELNHYVKMSKFDYHPDDLTNFNSYQLVIASERSHQELLKLNAHCRANKIYFIAVDCYGPYGLIFNDFGDNFEVLDKDGEEPTEVLVEDISLGEKGIVKLVKGYRHPYEDGDTIRIAGVKGMKSISKEGQSINGTLHVIKVIDSNSFEIGNTTDYTPYEGEGTVKNLKTVKKISFKSLEEVSTEPNIDANLQYYDWSKSGKLKLLHTIFLALSDFTKQYMRIPLSWNKEDALNLVQLVQKRKAELSEEEVKYIKIFSYTCSGTFGSICAFFGGIVAQEAFKAITGKYTPINQYFLAEFSEIIESPPDDQQAWNNYVSSRLPVQDRTQGLRRIIGGELIKKLQDAKLFMIGSGAIGCQLLKNFAMIELGAGTGSITVTDPDHIENSNLNRQFLFREKHLRKPKSATASAAVIQMNPRLKGHIKAKLDKVCEATREVFSNQFFEELDIVANALDNVEARRYVDTRCVQSKVALLQSGTLSSKGHVQVIIPYKTETYGNMQDPNDAQGDIPHCTLKMFPEQTLHCVEWARDLFGKQFTLGPKALKKLLEAGSDYAVGPSDLQMLRECIKLIENRPHNFEDAIEAATKVFYQLYRNDIQQLLYTYPLDAKTKDGKPFWKLPKRPPTAIEEIDPNDPLHNCFLASYSVLIAKVYGIPFPKDFRTHERRQEIAETARKMKVEPFVPSDKAAKEMADEVNKESIGKEEVEQADQMNQGQENQQMLYAKFKEIVGVIKEEGEVCEANAEEFEKDDDQNGHIDLISSMANLRARNYKLEEMDWITVKLKAGRIMPALSTTTSCIAALQTIELVKYLRGCPLDSMRNAFLNLAIPSLTMGEPGPVEKIKVHETLETNIWQRWSVGPLTNNYTIGELIKSIQVKYGITVKGLTLAEGGQIYSDFVMSLESKKEEKEKLLSKTLEKLVNEEFGEEPCKFLDFTLVMGVGDTLIKHAPTLRVLLQN